MVSKASDDLPEPDRPVITISRSRGSSTSMFLRLCSRAPRMISLSSGITWQYRDREGCGQAVVRVLVVTPPPGARSAQRNPQGARDPSRKCAHRQQLHLKGGTGDGNASDQDPDSAGGGATAGMPGTPPG